MSLPGLAPTFRTAPHPCRLLSAGSLLCRVVSLCYTLRCWKRGEDETTSCGRDRCCRLVDAWPSGAVAGSVQGPPGDACGAGTDNPTCRRNATDPGALHPATSA